MKYRLVLIIAVVLLLVIIGGTMFNLFLKPETPSKSPESNWINLPPPAQQSQISIEEALARRRSVREYSSNPLTVAEISQILWAAQGINRKGGYRTAPSAGALYPLEVYLVSGEVKNLDPGIYRYHPDGHKLEKTLDGDKRDVLSKAALGQESINSAPAVILIAAVYERTALKYGERASRYVHMEVGSAAENIYLQAVSLDLGTVFIGAFYDDQVQKVLKLDQDEAPLSIMPIGRLKP